jgi:hypothetical protein
VTILAAVAFSALMGCAAPVASSGARAYEPHTMNVLLGASINRPETGVLIGANYEYRKDDKLGFGGFADIAFSDEVSTGLGGLVFWHPADRWSVFGGPGVLFVDGDADVIARVGGAYTIPVKKWTLAPTAWVDLGDDVAVFIGAALVLHF